MKIFKSFYKSHDTHVSWWIHWRKLWHKIYYPFFTSNPIWQEVEEFNYAIFTVAAENYDSLQWYKGGVPVGSNSTSYSFLAKSSDDGIDIFCEAKKGNYIVKSNTAQLKVLSYVYVLDGETQYWELSRALKIKEGDIIEFSFMGFFVVDSERRFLASSDYVVSLHSWYKKDIFKIDNFDMLLDGASVVNSSAIPQDNKEHLVRLIAKIDFDLPTLLSAGINRNSFMNLPVYDFNVYRDDQCIYSIRLNNKSQGESQLPFIGDVSCLLVNYTPAVWIEKGRVPPVKPLEVKSYELNGVNSGAMIKPITLYGDFEISFKIKYKSKSYQTIIGNSDNETSYISLISASQLRFQQSSGFVLINFDNPLVHNVLYTCVIKRIGLVLSVNFSDHATGSRVLKESNPLEFNSLFKNLYGNRAVGYFYDFVITEGEIEVFHSKMDGENSSFSNFSGERAIIDNYEFESWVVREEYQDPIELVGVDGIRQRMKMAQSGVNGYNYIVTGDSTRYNGYNMMIDYYSHQFKKINMFVVNNSQSGQSANRWLANLGGSTLDSAINKTPLDGQRTIMEFSFGLNDYSLGFDYVSIKETILQCISTYLKAKPRAIVFLVSPTPTGNLIRNSELEVLYNELSSELELYLVNSHVAMISVFENNDYMQDTTHPNSNGSVRLVNFITSNILPSSLYTHMTLDDKFVAPIPLASPELAKNVTFGEVDVFTGIYYPLGSSRVMLNLDVEPNFRLTINSLSNQGSLCFYKSDGTFISSDYFNTVKNDVTIPPAAFKVSINISSEGDLYDSLNDIPSVKYIVEPVAPLSMQQINKDLLINQSYN